MGRRRITPGFAHRVQVFWRGDVPYIVTPEGARRANPEWVLLHHDRDEIDVIANPYGCGWAGCTAHSESEREAHAIYGCPPKGGV